MAHMRSENRTFQPYWEGEGIVLYHGDCREVLPRLEVHDLLLTDPPYGIGEAAGRNKSRSKPFGKTLGWVPPTGAIISPDYGDEDWDDEPISPELLDLCLHSAVKRIIFGGQYYDLPPTSCWLVWDKCNTGDFADCEIAWTNLRGANRLLRWRWNGLLKQMPEKRFHPTQKPVSVMKWCVRQYLEKEKKEHAEVLDPFAGSGSTLVAAYRMGVKATGIEQSEKYCRLIVRRLESETPPLPMIRSESRTAQEELFQ